MMPFMPIRWRLTLLTAGLLFASAPLYAQTNGSGESFIARARVSVALRDSLLRLSPENFAQGLENSGLSADTAESMATFLRDPFSAGKADVPTLDMLDRALALVNKCLPNPCPPPGQATQSAPGMGGVGSGVGNLASGLFGSAALPSEAQLLMGLTDFMVARARDDVAFGFVLTLRNNIRNDRWVRIGLPSSYQLMQRMDDGTYSTFLPVLRAAFVEDLNALPGRAYLLADSLGQGGSTSIYLRGLAIAYERGLEIRQGTPPAAALANLAGITDVQMPDASARRALMMVGLVAREYGAAGGEQLARELARDQRGWLRRYFVGYLTHGLLATQGSTTDADQLLKFMSTRETDVVLLVNQLDAMRILLQDVQRTVQTAAADLQSAGGESQVAAEQAQSTVDRALASAGAVLQVMSTGQRFLHATETTDAASVATFRQFVGDANTLHQAFLKRDYASLVTWVLQRPELNLCLGELRSVDDVRTEIQRNVEQEIISRRSGGGTEALSTEEQARVDPLVRQRLADVRPGQCGVRAQYMSFAASLASARSAEEVTIALRQASAPVGSYRAKRNQRRTRISDGEAERTGPWSASLGGYLGVTGGWEDGGANHFGAALPVGAEVSWGVPWGALSLFVPVIDLGTLASTRFNDDEADGEEELDEAAPTFQQVLAPGAFLVWNISRSIPASVGFGVQRVPGLRKRGGERVDVGRFSIFVGVDVTALNFRF